MSKTLQVRIVAEIQRLAKSGGQPPGQSMFQTETGIRPHEWRGRFWANWGDALKEAGFQPNKFTERADSGVILRTVADLTLRLGHVPTGSELMLLRRSDPTVPSPKTVTQHFRKEALMIALHQLSGEEDAYTLLGSLVQTLPLESPQITDARSEGWVYLLSSGSFHKIGRSDAIERRIKEIRVAQPEAANLVHAIRTDDPSGIESYWHKRFSDRRANGEWFKLTKSDIAAFKRRKFQ